MKEIVRFIESWDAKQFGIEYINKTFKHCLLVLVILMNEIEEIIEIVTKGMPKQLTRNDDQPFKVLTTKFSYCDCCGKMVRFKHFSSKIHQKNEKKFDKLILTDFETS